MKKSSEASEEDSFGLVGIMSAGAILGVLVLNLFVKTDDIVGVLNIQHVAEGSLFGAFISELPKVAIESFIALLPILLMFIIFQRTVLHLPARPFKRMLLGLTYTYIGLVIFLVGVNAGFMDVGNIIGYGLASYENKAILIGFGFLLGMLVILSEPAVYVLTQQIEDVTNGYIKRKTVLTTLSLGVAVAVGLSTLRIVVPEIQLWHYLLPGYLIALILAFFVPKIFIGIAFDSGGVASGPMTATFILAFAQGASEAIEHSDILKDSFGVIAMVALTPLIALQLLGLIYTAKSKGSEE